MELPYGNSAPPGPRQQTPHVRLNSGIDNLLNAMQSSSSRSLTTFPPQDQPLRPTRSRPTLYTNMAGESAELLLPPRRSKMRPYRDEDSPVTTPVLQSPIASANTSRRSSWSTDSAGSQNSRGPFASPFDDSRAPSRAGSDDGEGINTQTVAERFNIQPNSGLLLFPEDVEKDDYMHNPDPNEKEGGECDVYSGRGIINVGGLALITLGVLILFIGYPVL
jgi:hypothetical protein